MSEETTNSGTVAQSEAPTLLDRDWETFLCNN